MNSFYEHHKDSIRWHYRCFDRILLNGLIQPFQQPERVVGFFNTYRQLYPVSRHMLRDIAEQFQRWLKEWSEKRDIPMIEAPKGRRDDFVDPYFKGAKPDAVVVILKAREPARIMTAIGDRKRTAGICRSPTAGSSNTTSISTTGSGDGCSSASVPICRSPPASASISIIGWPTACVRRASEFKQCANAFVRCAEPERLQQLANSLTPSGFSDLRPKMAGAPHAVLYRQGAAENAGCQHRLFFSQVEFCDNLIFRRRAALDKLGERLLDANRTIGQPNKITMIFGRRISKHYRGKLQTEIEDMDLPNPVIRSHYGNGFVKQYVRDHLMLRTEAASNNVNDYGVNKSVENLPVLRNALSAINDNYLNVQQDILETFIDRGQLRQLAEPTITPTGKRIPGLKLDHPRQLALMHALVRFAHIAGGNTFTTAELYPRVLAALGCAGRTLHARLASLRSGKAPGQRVSSPSFPTPAATNCCRAVTQSVLIFLKLFERVYAPLTAGLLSPVSADRQVESAKAIATRSPLSARRRRPRCSRPGRRPQSRMTTASNENKIPTTATITV